MLIRIKQVIHKTGKSRSSIYAAIKEGTFPAPISLGPRSVGWIEAEINAWIESRITESRGVVAVPHTAASSALSV